MVACLLPVPSGVDDSWLSKMEREVLSTLQGPPGPNRSNNHDNVASWLRAVRNARHHIRDFGAQVQEEVGWTSHGEDGVMRYFDSTGPRLLYVAWEWARKSEPCMSDQGVAKFIGEQWRGNAGIRE